MVCFTNTSKCPLQAQEWAAGDTHMLAAGTKAAAHRIACYPHGM